MSCYKPAIHITLYNDLWQNVWNQKKNFQTTENWHSTKSTSWPFANGSRSNSCKDDTAARPRLTFWICTASSLIGAKIRAWVSRTWWKNLPENRDPSASPRWPMQTQTHVCLARRLPLTHGGERDVPEPTAPAATGALLGSSSLTADRNSHQFQQKERKTGGQFAHVLVCS